MRLFTQNDDMNHSVDRERLTRASRRALCPAAPTRLPRGAPRAAVRHRNRSSEAGTGDSRLPDQRWGGGVSVEIRKCKFAVQLGVPLYESRVESGRVKATRLQQRRDAGVNTRGRLSSTRLLP